MENLEIIKNNELIAEFMGANFDVEGRISFLYSSNEHFPFTERDFNHDLIADEVSEEVEEFGSGLNVEVKSYHNSWDWLMPVVEKIESLEDKYDYFTVNISGGNNPYIESSTGELIADIAGFELTKIQATYKAVVEFIKWYNKQ